MSTPKPVSPDFAAMAREIIDAWLASGKQPDGPEIGDLADAVTAKLTQSHAAGREEGLTEAAKYLDGIWGLDGHARAVRRLVRTSSEYLSWLAADADAQDGNHDIGPPPPPIRALASAPVAGDQVAEDSRAIGMLAGLGVVGPTRLATPAPAPGLAAQEVERLKQFLAHIHLHLTNDEEFDTDEFERDLRTLGAGKWIDTETLLIEARQEVERLRTVLGLADAALTEAEAILGGEYGDHYGTLCEKMLTLRAEIAALSSPRPAQAKEGPTE